MRFENENPYAAYDTGKIAARADQWERATFLQRTYAHLGGAIILFVLLEWLAFQMLDPAARGQVVRIMFGSPWTWLLVLGGMVLVGNVAQSMAQSATSLATQYAGLGLYVVGEAVIFMPMLFVADAVDKGQGLISTAAIITLVMFGGLTAFVFLTKVDLSGWGKYLTIASFAALGCIVVMMFVPGARGIYTFFVIALIVLASGYILYQTSNVMHHYRTDQYVVAALAMFAAVALLFWYVLQLVMSSSD